MENFNNDFFGFNDSNNEVLEQTNNFNYGSISGLGESNYENEDLFNTEVDYNNSLNNNYDNDNYANNYENNDELVDELNYSQQPVEQNVVLPFVEDYETVSSINFTSNPFANLNIDKSEQMVTESETSVETPLDEVDTNYTNDYETFTDSESSDETSTQVDQSIPVSFDYNEENTNNFVENDFDGVNIDNLDNMTNQNDEILETTLENGNNDENQNEEECYSDTLDKDEEEITISDTPIEELNKLTQYEEEKIEETDINSLFDRVSVNVKDASEIFRKNTDLKHKIDTRFEQLKKLQSEITNSRQKQLDEINSYKEEVFNKLTEKKEEIEKRLNLLKESQATLEKEKQEFELYKKKEQQNIDRVQKEVQSAYDDRREELGHIEDVLRKQKDALDEERSQLSLDRIQYESDKNELANNLLKFNELVNSFTNGMNDIKE